MVRGDFVLKGTRGNFLEGFLVAENEVDITGILCVEARDASKPPAMYKTAIHNKSLSTRKRQ